MLANARAGRPPVDKHGELIDIGQHLLVNGLRRKVIYLHPVIVIIPRERFNECLIIENPKETEILQMSTQVPKTRQKRMVGTTEARNGLDALNDPEVLKLYRGGQKGHKYNAQKLTIDGITFDSKAEGRRYQQLKLMEQAGQIHKLELQPRFVLQKGFRDQWSGKRIRAVTYKADFRYIEDGHTVIEDVKGKETAVFSVKWKWCIRLHPGIEFKIFKP